MTPPRCAYLIPLAMLAACAGGTTMRVADDEATDDTPVALAPTPDTTSAPIDSTVGEPSSPELTADQQPASAAQGYAPYGGSTTPPNLRRLGQWTHTGISEARRLVIRDANAWAEFWSELGVGDRPAVDFSRDLVIAVTAGQQPTGGYEIAVSQVSSNNGELAIEVVETRPGPNCVTTSALTQPVDVVVVSAVNSRGWSFVERKEVKGCR